MLRGVLGSVKRRLKSFFGIGAIDKRVSIGAYTYGATSKTFLLFKESDRVTIGKFCSIAYGVKIIASGEHNYRAVSNFPFYAHYLSKGGEKDTFTKGEVIIGNDVWIGARATILSGVTIGDGAVIGAGAVVIGDVLPYSIVGGVPAKLIKFRFSDEIINKLLAIRWWDWPSERLGGNIDDFYLDVKEFLDKAGSTRVG
jgi:acetyltransferase-like isoleucine patch superfamily enzyme